MGVIIGGKIMQDRKGALLHYLFYEDYLTECDVNGYFIRQIYLNMRGWRGSGAIIHDGNNLTREAAVYIIPRLLLVGIRKRKPVE